ncbi:thioester reductase domain-containing protein [Streptomyces sp. NPDC013181]|uniref:thioester reductase domain-containing protein n=1 Tax=Streptomyces sp. NPDC013181 TaxID=3364864 RepID=UPI003698AF79
MTRQANLEDIYELAPMQRGMLFHSLLSPDDGTYVEQCAVTLNGPVDHAAFWRAWELVVARHPALRSAFHWEKLAAPVQTVHRSAPLAREEEDWRSLGAEEQTKRLDDLLSTERREGFRLQAPPLLRITLIRTGDESYRIALRLCHLVVDGWSIGIMFSEFVEAYRAHCRGREPMLAPPGRFRDYIAWWKDRDTSASAAFWQNHLDGYRPHPPLFLETGPEEAGEPREQPQDLPHDWEQISLAGLAPELRTFARTKRVTLHTVFQAAWAVVLSRATGLDDLVLGTTFAHRPAEVPGVERAVGCMLATAPIRTRISPATSVDELLRGVHEMIVAARDHLGISLTGIQEALPDTRGQQLFESLVEFQNMPLPEIDLREEKLELVDVHMDTRAHVPLTLLVLPFDDLPVRLVHDRRRVGTDAAHRLLDAMRRTLHSLVSGERLVADLDADAAVRTHVPAPGGGPALSSASRGSAATEAAISALMREMLQVPAIDPEDDLMALGMHSLLGTRVVNRIADEHGVTVPLGELFAEPTVGRLAALIDGAAAGTADGTGGAPAPVATAPAGPDLAAEVVLDDAIRATAPPHWTPEPGRILLTGATGTVGRHLLAELLTGTGATVDCLVRADSAEEGHGRVRAALAEEDLWQDSFADRIRAIPGTLSRPQLGLTEQEFMELAEEVDEIYHCGGVVNFLPPYRRVKPVNVDGCREILRLAAAGGRTTPVHHISTTGVFGETDGSGGGPYREEPLPAVPPRQDHGYGQSKWVAERIMSLAADRGIPVRIHRLGRMAGHSRTGRWKLGDVLSEAIRACVVLGQVPETDAPVDLTPVDYAAAALAKLARAGLPGGEVNHLTNPAPFRLSALAEAMEAAGYPVRTVAPDAWYRSLLELSRTSADGKWGMVLDIVGPWARQIGQGLEEGPYETVRTACALGGQPVCPPADAELLGHYLRSFAAAGFIPAPGEVTAG